MDRKPKRSRNITAEEAALMLDIISDGESIEESDDMFSDVDDDIIDKDYHPDLDATSQDTSDRDDLEEVAQEVAPQEEIDLDDDDFQGFQDHALPSKVDTRKKQSNPITWKRNKRKASCNKGEEHVDQAGRVRPARSPKPQNCNSCRFKCSENFPAEIRLTICKEYWSLGDYKRQKDFILGSCKEREIIRRSKQLDEGEEARKNKSKIYQLMKKDGSKQVLVRVCKAFYLKTLDIGQGKVNSAFKGIGDAGTFVPDDQRGKSASANKTSLANLAYIREHINSFPTIESHYTRKSTKRMYLSQSLNIAKMHRLYEEKCKSENPPLVPVYEGVYRKVFCTEYNLSFFQPKKDQCNVCVKFENMTGKEKEDYRINTYNSHMERKDRAQKYKTEDKVRASSDKAFMSATFDLQSVLQIPAAKASILYYSRKLCTYNLCIYEAPTPNNAYCYCWSEVEGKRGSNEIGTAVFKYLQNLPSQYREISLFSDTCGGQNRNQNMAAMMLYAVQKLDKIHIIVHNFLESGHSHMECDSMHAAIEFEKKWTNVNSMLDWISIFQRSRRKNPYRVNNLHHEDFSNFQIIAKNLVINRNKDEFGNIVNWLLIKSLKYTKNEPGVIQYRYDFNEEFKKIFVFGRGRMSYPNDLPSAYKSRLPISIAKKKDLVNLCKQKIIPSELHPWFADLPTSVNVKDLLPEPGAEDSGNDDE